jgi:hypothetical protein
MVSAWVAAALIGGGTLLAQYDGVASTVHNLSISGPGEIRALTETEICKLCNIPPNAVVPAPLWGHELSKVQYELPQTRRDQTKGTAVLQPDGSSRLCLSCHDGTVALGDVGGRPRPIEMEGKGRLSPGRKGHLGTDLTGSHPISFVVPDGEEGKADYDSDLGLKARALVRADPEVRLDANGKMQCTTCHDPHSDRYYGKGGRVPRFWVKPTVDEVCLTCHVLR